MCLTNSPKICVLKDSNKYLIYHSTYMSVYTVIENENMVVNTFKSLPFIETHPLIQFPKLNSPSIMWCELHQG